jgi:carbon storage regulator
VPSLPSYSLGAAVSTGALALVSRSLGEYMEGKVMPVLSRKRNESIVINDDIVVMVVDVRGDKVRLGIEAPKEVPVHRREVYDAIRHSENSREDRQGGALSDT